ncbi:MAG: tetratricopeptide repeat protein [Gemmatimonadota bacterium]
MSNDAEAVRRLDLLDAVNRRRAAGDYAGIRVLLEDDSPETLLGEAALGYWLAYARRRLGETEAALELAEALEEPCLRDADRQLHRKRTNLEAMALFDLGRVDDASERWSDLLGLATAAGDNPMVAHAANNLGVVATLRGQADESLAHHARALAAYERLADGRGIALTHQNLGIAYRERGLPREAEAHFRAAARAATPGSDEDVLARAQEERAVLFLMRGDPSLAEATAERARHRLAKVADRAGVAECLRVIGLARLVAGRRRDAQSPLREALRLAQEVGAALLEAETLEALAAVEPNEAEALHARADEIFGGLGAQGWGASVRERVAGFVEMAERGASP